MLIGLILILFFLVCVLSGVYGFWSNGFLDFNFIFKEIIISSIRSRFISIGVMNTSEPKLKLIIDLKAIFNPAQKLVIAMSDVGNDVRSPTRTVLVFHKLMIKGI
tara:strand:+ start:90395 stop:90709 length:315 start_codon:yes stop_codon:yes gene_type:complete